MKDIRALIGRLTVLGAQSALNETARKLTLSTAKLLRGKPEKARWPIGEILDLASFVETEAASWIEPEDIASGGPFDACDLRHYLAAAEVAGVPYIPAKEILRLHEDEITAIDQVVRIPEHVSKTIKKGMKAAFPELPEAPRTARHDATDVMERLFTAMDDVDTSWMVRSNLAGSSMLKSLAGSGVLGDGAAGARDGARLTESIEVGAGWVSHGNRRRIDALDSRFIDTFARGHKDTLVFLARPWMTAGRREECADPHRHGTPFAGKGSWPHEWRVFVENGEVTGVASYYGWIGAVTAENAEKAFLARELGQRVADALTEMHAIPKSMEVEILRKRIAPQAPISELQSMALEKSRVASVTCTLDFMETEDGMMLLEGGPGHLPIGGGHPCAFAGFEARPDWGGYCRTEGVAFRLIDGVCLGDPATWQGKQNDGAIMDWDEALEFLTGDRALQPEAFL